jgi:Ser/Thr protein kinase RdoA (MazF antagonist)
VAAVKFPEHLMRDAGLDVTAVAVPVREGRAWLADWQGIRGVLRGRSVSARAADPVEMIGDVAWLHGFLAALAGSAFPAPRPLPAFGGRSWALEAGQLWELVSFLPGRAAGWSSEPSMGQIGALLARYHAAAGRVRMSGQRPGVIPLDSVPAVLLSRRLGAKCPDGEQAAEVRRLAARLAGDLDNLSGLAPGPRIVIHGDFTNHNVLAHGIPPAPAGVIDFDRAYLEMPVADIGFGLWRSGRPHQEAAHLDLGKLSQFVRGYARTIPLPADAARALPVFLYGRGLQMLAKRVLAGQCCG